MNAIQPWIAELTGSGIVQAIVLRVEGEEILVGLDGGAAEPVHASLLHSTDAGALQLATGDIVLVWRSSGDAARGVVLGRVGPTSGPPPAARDAVVPDTLLLEAKQELTLRVGDGSITIRADGKILIKGKDLVSHATRVNRIKGGSVAIN